MTRLATSVALSRPTTLRTTELIVHPDGDDDAPGTAADPLRTFVRATELLPDNLRNERYIITLDPAILEEPGFTFDWLTPASAEQITFDTDPARFHPSVYINNPVTLRSQPIVVETLNDPTTTVSVDPLTGLIQITDTSQSWTIDEHVGRFPVGAGTLIGADLVPPFYGSILSNTSDTLVVSSIFVPDAPIQILEPGPTLRFGPATNPLFDPGTGMLITARCGLTIQWINFETPAANTFPSIALAAPTLGLVAFAGCRIDGIEIQAGGKVDVDESYVTGSVAVEGYGSDPRNFRRSTFATGHTFAGHRGSYFALGSRFDGGTAPWGTGVTSEPEFQGVQIEQCELTNFSSDAVRFRGGVHKLFDTRISDSTGAAIRANGGTSVRLRDLDGSGNTTYGLVVRDGADVQIDGTMTLVGDSGEIDAGGNIGDTTWATVASDGAAEWSASTAVRLHPVADVAPTPPPSGGSGRTLVATTTLGADSNSIILTGLDGDTDLVYEIEAAFLIAQNDATRIDMRPRVGGVTIGPSLDFHNRRILNAQSPGGTSNDWRVTTGLNLPTFGDPVVLDLSLTIRVSQTINGLSARRGFRGIMSYRSDSPVIANRDPWQVTSGQWTATGNIDGIEFLAIPTAVPNGFLAGSQVSVFTQTAKPFDP